MPRGVYERKNKKNKVAAVEAKIAQVERPAAPNVTATRVAALPTPGNTTEAFSILRDNITTLASVRSQMAGSDLIAKKTEAEILQHVAALSDLRKRSFGATTDEHLHEKAAEDKYQQMAGNTYPSTFPSSSPFA